MSSSKGSNKYEKSGSSQSGKDSPQSPSKYGLEQNLELEKQPRDVKAAIGHVKKWMLSQFIDKNINEKSLSQQIGTKQSSWEFLWGSKFTGDNEKLGIKNLGLVIGEEYKVLDPNTQLPCSLGSYRVDWDPDKKMHINIIIKVNNPRRKEKSIKWAYRFTLSATENNNETNLNISNTRNNIIDDEHSAEIIKNTMLQLTLQALQRKQHPDEDCALKIIKAFLIKKTIHTQYFNEFSFLLRPLIFASYTAIEKQNNLREKSFGQYSQSQLSLEVTTFLYAIWRPKLEAYLDKIMSYPINEIPDDTEDETSTKEIFISECTCLLNETPEFYETRKNIIDFIRTKTARKMNHLIANLNLLTEDTPNQSILSLLTQLSKQYADTSPAVSPSSKTRRIGLFISNANEDKIKTTKKSVLEKDEEKNNEDQENLGDHYNRINQDRLTPEKTKNKIVEPTKTNRSKR